MSVLLDEALGFSAENEAAEFGKAADMTTMTVYLKVCSCVAIPLFIEESCYVICTIGFGSAPLVPL